MTFRGLLIVVSAAVGLAVLGMALLGLPGAMWLAVSAPVIEMIWGRMQVPADAGWPLAIMVTQVWPVALVLAYVGVSLARLRGTRLAVAMVAGTFVGAVVLTVLVFGLLIQQQRS